jgi:phage shock protein A
MTRMYMRGSVYFGTAAEMMDRIEELEAKLATCEKYRDAYAEMGRIGTEAVRDLDAKLAKSEARSEVLETLVMDVAADLYDGVPAHRIDQRIGDVMKQLNEEGEDQ